MCERDEAGGWEAHCVVGVAGEVEYRGAGNGWSWGQALGKWLSSIRGLYFLSPYCARTSGNFVSNGSF